MKEKDHFGRFHARISKLVGHEMLIKFSYQKFMRPAAAIEDCLVPLESQEISLLYLGMLSGAELEVHHGDPFMEITVPFRAFVRWKICEQSSSKLFCCIGDLNINYDPERPSAESLFDHMAGNNDRADTETFFGREIDRCQEPSILEARIVLRKALPEAKYLGCSI